MITNLPETADSLIHDAETKGHDLIEALYRLQDHVEVQVDQAAESERPEFEAVSTQIWQAIGLAQGALHSCQLAKQRRPRILT